MTNTNGLAKLYDRLQPGERLALLIAAGARGDDAEHARLARSAPRVSIEFGHHFPLGYAFKQTAFAHRAECLGQAAAMFLAGCRSGAMSPFARAAAFALQANLGGWQLFCRERGIDAAAIWDLLPAGAVLEEAIGVAEVIAFTVAEALAFQAEFDGDEAPSVVTAESVARSLGELYDHYAESVGGTQDVA